MFDRTSYDLNVTAVPMAVTAAGVLVLGILVLLREPRSRVSVLFALLTFPVFVWLSGMAAMYCSLTEDVAKDWARVIYVAIPLISPAIYHFTTALLGIERARVSVLVAVWTAGFAFALLIPFTGLFIRGVYEYWWGWYTNLSPNAAVFLAFFCVPLVMTAVEFFRQHRTLDPTTIQGRRIRALMIAIGVGYLGLVDYLGSFGIAVYPSGFLAVSGFLILSVRAIWKYRLVALTPQFAAGKILETMQGAVIVIDLEGNIRLVNRAACEMLGWEEGALTGMPMTSLVATPLNIGRASDTLMMRGAIRDRAMVWRRQSGETMEMSVSASMLRDEEGIPAGIVYVGSDVTDKRRSEQIEYQAFHDSLTGLPNRLFFRRQLDAILEDGSPDRSIVVLFIDLDGFKIINDSLGHTVGDQLLQLVAARFRKTLRDGDFIARLGGDEFTVVASVREPADGALIAEKLLDAARRPFDLAGQELYVTASIGIAVAPNHGEDAETLVKNADTAMYLAKELGKDNQQICGPTIQRRARERLDLESRLRRAVDNGEFLLYYQPIVSATSEKIVGAEALLRWHVNGEVLAPAEFLPVAEESRLIEPIGEWVIRQACSDVATFITDDSIHVAINLSVHQLQQRYFHRLIEETLGGCGADPSRLVFEITETVAMQNVDRIITTLHDLKELGTSIAIDDFGTGYSALSYLARLPADVLKIDRSFMTRVGIDDGCEAIVRAIQAIADALQMRVVAEGVENRSQLNFVRDMGCDAVQGYLFSPPVPLSRFLRLLNREAALGSPATERGSRRGYWVEAPQQ